MFAGKVVKGASESFFFQSSCELQAIYKVFKESPSRTRKTQQQYVKFVQLQQSRNQNDLNLHITYNDQLTDFNSLLSNQNEITIHQRNLQVLMTEIYKIINHIAPPIMSSLPEIRENTNNTRYFQVLSNESRRTINYGLETICYRAPFLWANLPPEYKLANSLNIFKRKIKNWKGENCPCRLCKTYVRELGYI